MSFDSCEGLTLTAVLWASVLWAGVLNVQVMQVFNHESREHCYTSFQIFKFFNQ